MLIGDYMRFSFLSSKPLTEMGIREAGTWIHGRVVAEDAGEHFELGHEPCGSSPRPGPLRARRHVVAPAAALELEQPAAHSGAGAAVQVVRRRAPVEAHCGCTHE